MKSGIIGNPGPLRDFLEMLHYCTANKILSNRLTVIGIKAYASFVAVIRNSAD